MSHKIYLGAARILSNILYEVCNFNGALVDGQKTADKREIGVCAVRSPVNAEALGLEPIAEIVDVFVVGCAEAVEGYDGVVRGGAGVVISGVGGEGC